MSGWQSTRPAGGFRKYICFCLVDKWVFFSLFFFPALLHRISEYMDLTPAEVVGHTCYHFIHVEDLENIRQSHEDCESHLCAHVVSLNPPHPPLDLHSIWTWEAWRVWSSLTLSCCDRRPLLPQSWTANRTAGLTSCFSLLVLRKGQVVTGYYRWLQRRGGYLWIQSTATVSINHKAPHERNVIWVNYVLRWVPSV